MQIFLPFIALTFALRGVALNDWRYMDDLSALNARWYYSWSEACQSPDLPAGCVNMVRSMQLPQACYDYLLVGNEPDHAEPYGAPVSPGDAVQRVKAIESKCPQTKLVVGGVTGQGIDWLIEFLTLYPDFKQALAVHCYAGFAASGCIKKLTAMRALYAGPMWLTEWNCLYCNWTEFVKLLSFADRNFERHAVYTNRYRPEWVGIPEAALVNDDGTLTENGWMFANYSLKRKVIRRGR